MRYKKRLNIKRVILFPVIVYTAYVFIDSFLPLFMVGFVIWLLYAGLARGGFGEDNPFDCNSLWSYFPKFSYNHCSFIRGDV